MKTLLIFPPVWDINLAPMLSTPLLTSMLKEEGHNAEFIDANSSFMNFILNKDFLNYYQSKISFYENILQNLYKNPPSKNNIQIKNTLENYIKEFHFSKKYLLDFYENTPNIQTDLDKIFYNSEVVNNHYNFLRTIINKMFYKDIDENIPNEYRLFFDWEQNLIHKIEEYEPELICFSVYCEQQYIWTLNFSKKIKSKTQIIWGGSYITSNRYNLQKNVFKECVDICIYGNGEIPLKLIANKEPLENISNIIYLDNNENIKINKNKYSAFKFYIPEYDNTKLKEYFVPENVIPIESSRGCYWGKCAFCDFMDCSIYKQKNINDLIAEIKEYIDRYKVNRFFFTDAAMHPLYAEEFSKKVLENKLKIYYLSDFRLEKEFTQDLLQQMYDSGLRLALWGLESGSDRILKMYNKGTTVENNSKVITASSKAGIYNWCWTMINFPNETIDDINLTKDFLFKHYDYIDYISLNNFTILPNSPISFEKENFNLENVSFEKTSIYKPPVKTRIYAEKIRHEIFEKFQSKINLYSDDLTRILIKLTKERP